MNKNRWYCGFLVLISIFPTLLSAQSGNMPPVTKAFAVLSKSLESKSSVVGDELTLRTISDVVVQGEVVIPKDSRVIGHVGGVVVKGKDQPKSILAIVIDKAVVAGGITIPLQAIIVAIAAPQNSLSSDPTYGMMRSNEPKMVANPSTAASSGALSASSKASSTAAVATAEIKGSLDERLVLTEDSQGAFGYEESISITWQLSIPPPLTVFTSKAKNLKFEAGTQMLLRMVPPRLAK